MRFKIIKDLNSVEERIVNLTDRLSRMEKGSEISDEVDSEEAAFSEDDLYTEFNISYGTLTKVSDDISSIFESLKTIKRLMFLLSSLCVFSASLSLFVFFYTAAY